MAFHAIAVLPGGRQKSIVNKTEDQILSNVVLPFVSNGVVQAPWGKKTQSYQVLELRIYKTHTGWDKKSGVQLETFIGSSPNRFKHFEKRANALLSKNKYRVFIIMAIQGEKSGTQDQQRIYREYDDRFEALEVVLAKHNCVAIRIDKEHPIQELVGTIKSEIRKSQFVIADITDERPSCYFEAGYSEALGKPVIYVASKESVIKPGQKTVIHFDVHMNVGFFTNIKELKAKVSQAIQKNTTMLFAERLASEAVIKK
jgi:nucleoside 2-deoxyribosyltransferase